MTLVKPTIGSPGWGPVLNAALDTLAAQTASGSRLDLDRLARSSSDRATSLASSQARYADAGGWVEDWSSAPAAPWQLGGETFATAPDHLYGGAPGDYLTRPVGTGVKRYRTLLNTTAGGAERIVMAGWSSAPLGTRGTADNFFAVGVHYGYGGTGNKIITWNQGGELIPLDYTPGDKLLITAWQDELYCGVELTSLNGEVVVSLVRPLNVYTPRQFGLFNSDARGAPGDWFGPVTGRDDAVTSPARTYDAGFSSGQITDDKLGGTRIRVVLPKGYDSRVPAPVLIYCHGFGGSADTIHATGAASNIYTVVAHLAANGWIVVSSDAYGPAEVGSKYYAYWDAYRYVRDRYAIGRVCIGAESFGGVAAARLLAGRTAPNQRGDTFEIPDIAGLVGWYPVLDMAGMYASDTWVSDAVDAAYGTLANTTDPATLPVESYRGVPVKIWHSASDPVVDKAWSDALVARLAPATSTATVVATTGGHGDPSNFDPPAVLAFLNECVGR